MLNATDTPHRIVISGNWALPIFSHAPWMGGDDVEGLASERNLRGAGGIPSGGASAG